MASETQIDRSPKAIIEEAQRQTESEYVSLMNAMEASIPTNGEFFTKTGGKDTPKSSSSALAPSRVDTRALILNVGNQNKDGVLLKGVVTRKGLRLLAVSDGNDLNRNIMAGGNFREDENTKGRGEIAWENGKVSALIEVKPEEQEVFDKMFEGSIEAAKKTSITLEREKQKQDTAKRLMGLLSPQSQNAQLSADKGSAILPSAQPSTGAEPAPQI